ncbi:UDP-glucose 4-epimerase GalE [Catellatospora sp. NPDC049133]|jgi:UDP-glucose 4-epimerase|uniref:UDP-glucose 4-epimerase GalE n=1 Tax=Catellatospora sp. NPDC049133 TaxID=3155499 RepID=UPI00340B2EDA
MTDSVPGAPTHGGLKVLITGGAGYIGSTIATACLDSGITPVILDNLSTGRREFTTGRAFFEGDVADGTLVDRVFAEHPDIFAVVHCAALTVVPDSVAQPLRYYRENLAKTVDFVDHLLRNGCRRLIFSSTAAIYQPGPEFTVDEDSPIGPVSPYGRTKAMVESVLADVCAAEDFAVISLRYFNPIGADPLMRTGLQLPRPTHALGKMIEAVETGEPFRITGTDFESHDGTGIRDYIHVWDLARAHVAALVQFDEVLAGEPESHLAVNIGTGRGTTVRELVDALDAVRGVPLPTVAAPRRAGDVVGAHTRVDRARKLLDFSCEYTVEDGVRHALEWAAVRAERLDAPADRG